MDTATAVMPSLDHRCTPTARRSPWCRTMEPTDLRAIDTPLQDSDPTRLTGLATEATSDPAFGLAVIRVMATATGMDGVEFPSDSASRSLATPAELEFY